MLVWIFLLVLVVAVCRHSDLYIYLHELMKQDVILSFELYTRFRFWMTHSASSVCEWWDMCVRIFKWYFWHYRFIYKFIILLWEQIVFVCLRMHVKTELRSIWCICLKLSNEMLANFSLHITLVSSIFSVVPSVCTSAYLAEYI